MVTERQPHRHPPLSNGFPDPRATDAREELQRTLVPVVKLLSANAIRFVVAGNCAAYVLGGTASEYDVAIVLTRDDAQHAAEASASAGMPAAGRREDRASPLQSGGAAAPVIVATDLMIDKLHEGTHRCDFVPMVQLAWALCERVDWSIVITTADSPYARAGR
ncbi:hypothetical protein [Rhodococcus jostii]|uniref:Uncharacterized protein n=1 Tax=Rhodococcus jostii TaxID=132919 RepID=A0A1H4RZD7_RHOJO|nr:hypothetical protein [Rhodococcus jostii]SEC37270.1 hypothetical protein SAMN04490220_1468 [Rhodococcus jostii]